MVVLGISRDDVNNRIYCTCRLCNLSGLTDVCDEFFDIDTNSSPDCADIVYYMILGRKMSRTKPDGECPDSALWAEWDVWVTRSSSSRGRLTRSVARLTTRRVSYLFYSVRTESG